MDNKIEIKTASMSFGEGHQLMTPALLDAPLVPTVISSLEQAIEAQKRIQASGKSMLADAIGIGDWLHLVKRDIGHGSWCDWQKSNKLGLSQQTINNYMRLSEHKSELLTISKLSLTDAYSFIRKKAAPNRKARGKRPKTIDAVATVVTTTPAVIKKVATIVTTAPKTIESPPVVTAPPDPNDHDVWGWWKSIAPDKMTKAEDADFKIDVEDAFDNWLEENFEPHTGFAQETIKEYVIGKTFEPYYQIYIEDFRTGILEPIGKFSDEATATKVLELWTKANPEDPLVLHYCVDDHGDYDEVIAANALYSKLLNEECERNTKKV